MSDIDDLKTAIAANDDAIAAIKSSIDAAVAKINDLSAQILAATNAGDSAAIQEIVAQIRAETTALTSDKTTLDAAVAPPAAPAASADPATT